MLKYSEGRRVTAYTSSAKHIQSSRNSPQSYFRALYSIKITDTLSKE